MIYANIREGVFRARPNRFVAEVELDGKIERCHVKNTGRLKELLIPGARAYVNLCGNPGRATMYDLVAIWKDECLVNVDSSAPNKVFHEHLKSGGHMEGVTLIKPEAKYGASRFDFYVEASGSKTFIEVKGVTLERDGVALFPDAPTERGVRHINELAHCVSSGVWRSARGSRSRRG